VAKKKKKPAAEEAGYSLDNRITRRARRKMPKQLRKLYEKGW